VNADGTTDTFDYDDRCNLTRVTDARGNSTFFTYNAGNRLTAYTDARNSWGLFVSRLVQRYRGLVKTWLIWNEPDRNAGAVRHTWAGSIADYYRLLKTAYQAAKAHDPACQVVVGGLTYWWDKENARPPFLESLLQQADADPTARDNHAYPDGVAAPVYNNPPTSFTVPPPFRRILAAHGLDKPLWVQYGRYMYHLVQLDFGYSITNYPAKVLPLILAALPWTIGLLAVSSVIDTWILLRDIELGGEWPRRSMAALVQQETGVDFLAITSDVEAPKAARKLQADVPETAGWDPAPDAVFA